MKTFRFIFDILTFMIVLIYPKPILFSYIIIHVWFKWVIKIPEKLDWIQHPLNITIPFTTYNK